MIPADLSGIGRHKPYNILMDYSNMTNAELTLELAECFGISQSEARKFLKSEHRDMGRHAAERILYKRDEAHGLVGEFNKECKSLERKLSKLP